MTATHAVDLLAEAAFIAAEADRGIAPRFSTEVRLDQPRWLVRSARVVATAHGVYEASIDGRPVTSSVLNPGWTSYEWRLQVQEFDVTDAIATGEGDVRLDILLGNGWYRGDLGFEGAEANYGDTISVAAVLELAFADGGVQRVGTSSDWRAEASDVTANSLYNGETIDFRKHDARLGDDAADAAPLRVTEVEVDRSTLVPQVGPLITRHEVLRPQKIWTSPSGRTLVDFGQNLVGWLRFTVKGEAGDTITIRHAEVLEHDELGTRPLRGAEATDRLILSGGEDFFEPTLTFHGFRYAELTGWPGELGLDSLEAVVVHSRMLRTSSFECSEPLVNQLIENSVWGQKGNFLDVPTDCPQRDERLGWTGDIAAYAASASFQFDTADFLHKWLLDVAEETRHNGIGMVPFVVPDVLKYAHFAEEHSFSMNPTAVWGDAAVWVPEALWTAYGDVDRLAAHYPGMVLHLDSVEKALSPNGLWDTGFQFGDWLDPDASPHDPAAAKADKYVVATACLYRSASFAAVAAGILGKSDDAERWAALAERTRVAFNEHYVSDDGRIVSDCATVYSLAICFALLNDDLRAKAGARLAELVRERDYRVTTGFAGTPFVTWALSDTGHVDDAYRLLLERENPSWLYPVTMGATTIWERWDSMLPDGTINPGEMTSFNHYALGAVADWIYQVVGGIRAAEPGYRKVLIQPVPGTGIDWARTSYQTSEGRIATSWRTGPDGFALEVEVPEEVEAEVVLPDGRTEHVVGGAHSFTA